MAASLAVACFATASTAHAVTSAEFYTPTGMGYGRFEARVMFPAGDGVVGSFFLWKEGSEVAGTYWNELDFEKIDANCSLQINSIYGAPNVQHPMIVSSVNNLCGAYHTYAYEWTPDYIAWAIDGQEVRRDTGAAAQAYSTNATTAGLEIRFNVWPGTTSFGGSFSPTILPVQEFISWVQYSTYTPGCGFALAWRESFEQGVPPLWAEGNWVSPAQLSTNSASNVTATNGVAVISLTADDMLGFTGTPPVDDGDLPSVQQATGPVDASALACDGGVSAPGDAGGSAAPASSATHSGGGGGGGCGVAASGVGGVGELIIAAALAIGTRRRRGPQRRRPHD